MIKFNNQGFISPIGKYLVPFDLVKSEFVDKFDTNSSRLTIFTTFIEYLSEFRKEITKEFEIFINGSFVTKKKNPGDIDFVIFVSCSCPQKLDSNLR